MKSLIIFALVTMSSFAFAGPEDHMYESCYSTNEVLPTEIPIKFCFDDAYLKADSNTLYVDGTYSNVPRTMNTTTLIRNTEDSYKFTATANIVNKWESGCGEGVTANLTISGKADFNGYTDPKSLKFTVKYEVTNDTCHSWPQDFTVEYFLSK